MQVRGSTLALKPRADVTKSPKQGHQWPTKRTDALQKLKKKFTFVCATIDTIINFDADTNADVRMNAVACVRSLAISSGMLHASFMRFFGCVLL